MKIKLSKSQWEQIGRTAGWGGFTEEDAKAEHRDNLGNPISPSTSKVEVADLSKLRNNIAKMEKQKMDLIERIKADPNDRDAKAILIGVENVLSNYQYSLKKIETKPMGSGKGEIGQNQLLNIPKFPVATDKPWGKPVTPSEQTGNVQLKPKKV